MRHCIVHHCNFQISNMAKPNKKLAQEHKEKGNQFFSQDKFTESIVWYQKAIDADPTDHVLHSNKSAAHAGNKDFDKALAAADQCIKLNAKWAKGYYRKAVALMALNRNQEALDTLAKGLSHDPTNADLKSKLEEAKKKGKPQGLDAKAEGNAHFKESRYEKAIESYTIALETIVDVNDKSTIYSNRAACHYQLRSYDDVVADCTESLTHVPTNVKSLLRRGLAYEALEKPKLALQDLQQVLSIEPNTALAQQAVHRIKAAQARFEQRGGK